MIGYTYGGASRKTGYFGLGIIKKSNPSTLYVLNGTYMSASTQMWNHDTIPFYGANGDYVYDAWAIVF